MADIFTALGMVDEGTLTKTEGEVNNDNEYTTWQEWRAADGTIVKREAQVRLKRGLEFTGEAGGIG